MRPVRLVMFGLLWGLVGCGQTGPLYLPAQQDEASQNKTAHNDTAPTDSRQVDPASGNEEP